MARCGVVHVVYVAVGCGALGVRQVDVSGVRLCAQSHVCCGVNEFRRFHGRCGSHGRHVRDVVGAGQWLCRGAWCRVVLGVWTGLDAWRARSLPPGATVCVPHVWDDHTCACVVLAGLPLARLPQRVAHPSTLQRHRLPHDKISHLCLMAPLSLRGSISLTAAPSCWSAVGWPFQSSTSHCRPLARRGAGCSSNCLQLPEL